MIVTVSCNPALDYLVGLPRLEQGSIHRIPQSQLRSGGKGVNVSLMLRQLGLSSTALGFVAGETGTLLEALLRRQGVAVNFIRLAGGMTRLNVKIHAGEDTQLNGIGPPVSPWEQQQLLLQLERLREGDVAILAGSLPLGVHESFYEVMVRRLHTRGVSCLVDACGNALRGVLPQKPLLVKPNHQELSELLGRPMASWQDIEEGARQLQKQGARQVLVSWQGQGALLLCEDGKALRQAAPQGKEVSPVGAGDALLAGFVAAMVRGEDAKGCLKWAVAAGSATAFTWGMAERAQVRQLLAGM